MPEARTGPPPQKPTSKKRGRPKGSTNRKPEQVAAELTRCPRCQSTDRGPYYRTTAAVFAGLDRQGRPFTHIVRRWTVCAACGQHRIDRFYENRVDQIKN